MFDNNTKLRYHTLVAPCAPATPWGRGGGRQAGDGGAAHGHAVPRGRRGELRGLDGPRDGGAGGTEIEKISIRIWIVTTH